MTLLVSNFRQFTLIADTDTDLTIRLEVNRKDAIIFYQFNGENYWQRTPFRTADVENDTKRALALVSDFICSEKP